MKRVILALLALIALTGTAHAQDPALFPWLKRSGGNMSGAIGLAAYANASEPVTCNSGNAGKIIYSTTSTALRLCDGSAWTNLGVSGAAAAAGTLTGTTLAANVVTSSLTSVGTLSAGAVPTTLLTGTITNAQLGGSIAASKLVGTDIATVGTVTAGTWSSTVTTSLVTLGTASTTTGQLKFYNSGSANATIIQAGSAAAARTYTWPTNFGNAGDVLTDAAGNGTLSWSTVSSTTAFNVITGGTNTSAAMVVGQGATIATTYTNILTAQTVGYLLSNSTASDATNTVQNSPAIKLSGAAWKSNSTAASQVNYGLIQYIPITGAAATKGAFSFYSSTAGGAETLNLSFIGNSTSTSVGAAAGTTFGSGNTYYGALAGGNGSAITATGVTAVGYNSLGGASAGGDHTTAIGNSSGTSCSGDENTFLGYNAGNNSGTSRANTYIGSSTNNNLNVNGSIALGAGAATTASNQAVIGGTGNGLGGVTSFYFGQGVTAQTPATINFTVTGGRSGTDTDTAGGLWNINGGLGTGAGAGGSVAIQTATKLSSGTGAQTLTARFTVSGAAASALATVTFNQTHVKSSQTTAPTTTLTSTTLNDGAGSGAAITVTAGGTDTRGTITITAGSGVPTAGIAGQIVFNAAYGSAPICTVTSIDTGGNARLLYVSAVGTSSFTLSADVAFVSGSAHSYNYHCLE